MTHSQAIKAVEDALTELKLTDPDGTPLDGILAGIAINKVVGKEWDDCFVRMMLGHSTPAQYVTECKRVIEKFQRTLQGLRLEKRLRRGA